jgi:anti-anti-sigma factor
MDSSATSFTARLEVDDREARVVLSGDIDLSAVPEFFERIQAADRAMQGRVVLIMKDVTLIDSSGLGVLARLAAAGVRMEIRGAAGITRRALDISGVGLSQNILVV